MVIKDINKGYQLMKDINEKYYNKPPHVNFTEYVETCDVCSEPVMPYGRCFHGYKGIYIEKTEKELKIDKDFLENELRRIERELALHAVQTKAGEHE